MEPENSKTVVFFDGSCQICQAEIDFYRCQDDAGTLRFVDVSESGAVIPEGITQRQAVERFHVRARDGRVFSGATAFVEVWARLPKWRWAARAAALPGALVVMEWGYRGFLPVRPFISRVVGRMLQRKAAGAGAKRG